MVDGLAAEQLRRLSADQKPRAKEPVRIARAGQRHCYRGRWRTSERPWTLEKSLCRYPPAHAAAESIEEDVLRLAHGAGRMAAVSPWRPAVAVREAAICHRFGITDEARVGRLCSVGVVNGHMTSVVRLRKHRGIMQSRRIDQRHTIAIVFQNGRSLVLES